MWMDVPESIKKRSYEKRSRKQRGRNVNETEKVVERSRRERK